MQAHAATVISCHDGDTCKFDNKGNVVKVRLAGIDAPEAKQAGGDQARKYLVSLLAGKQVDLNCNGQSYKRKVCALTVDGRDVAAEMVKAGWAWDYPRYSKKKYQKFMLQAQAARLGIWRNGTSVKRPDCFRHKC